MVNSSLETLIKPSINEIEKYLPGESKLDGSTKIIKLSSNESPFTPPKKVFEGSLDLIRSSNLYPDGDSLQLKQQIAEKFSLDAKNIVCGNGSDDILSVVAQTFATQNCEVICSEFGFIYYPIICRAAGCKVITAKSENLHVSCKNILKKITKRTRIIFIANPNNPTGTIILRDELTNFLDKVPKNIIVVLDGAYSEFITDNKYSDGTDMINKYRNLVVTRTFSKIFALAGLRLGWGYSNPQIIGLLEKVRGPFNVNSLAQKIGIAILREKKFLEKSIKHNNKWRKILPKEINSLGLQSYETFANFVIVKVDPSRFSKDQIIKILNQKKIIVRNLDNYGLNDYFRVSIGSSPHLKKFLIELKKAIRT